MWDVECGMGTNLIEKIGVAKVMWLVSIAYFSTWSYRNVVVERVFFISIPC